MYTLSHPLVQKVGPVRFAADFHNEYSHAFATRGNIFFIVALALLAASVAVVVVLRRSGKKQRMAKT